IFQEPLRLVSFIEFNFPCRVETTTSSLVHVNVTNGSTVIELVHQAHQRPLDVFPVEAWQQFELFWAPKLRGRLKEVDFINRFLAVANTTQRLRILYVGFATNRVRHNMVDFKSNAFTGNPAAQAGISIALFDLSLLGLAEFPSSPRSPRRGIWAQDN